MKYTTVPDSGSNTESNTEALSAVFYEVYHLLADAGCNPALGGPQVSGECRHIRSDCPTCRTKNAVTVIEDNPVLFCQKGCSPEQIKAVLLERNPEPETPAETPASKPPATVSDVSITETAELSETGLLIKKYGTQSGALPEHDMSRLLSQEIENLAYSPDRDLWYRFAQDAVADEDSLRIMANTEISQRLAALCETEMEGNKTNWRRKRKEMLSVKYRSAVRTHLETTENQLHVPGAEWNADPELIGTPDGVWSLRTLERIDPREVRTNNIKVSKRVAVAPEPVNLTGDDAFSNFIKEMCQGDQRQIDFLMLYLAHMLTGYTHNKKFLCLVGPKDRGKTVLSELLNWLFGDYACTVPQTTFAAKQPEQHSTLQTEFDGPRAVILDEQKAQKWNEELLKKIVGGGSIKARRMNQNYYEFTTKCKLLITSNNVPNFEASGAMATRLLVMRLDYEPKSLDRTLPEKLKAIGGRILYHLMRYAQVYLDEGKELQLTEQVIRERDQFLYEADPVLGFFELTYEVSGNRNDVIERKQMLADCLAWLKEHDLYGGQRDETLKKRLAKCCRELKSQGVLANKIGTDHVWRGLKLRTSY